MQLCSKAFSRPLPSTALASSSANKKCRFKDTWDWSKYSRSAGSNLIMTLGLRALLLCGLATHARADVCDVGSGSNSDVNVSFGRLLHHPFWPAAARDPTQQITWRLIMCSPACSTHRSPPRHKPMPLSINTVVRTLLLWNWAAACCEAAVGCATIACPNKTNYNTGTQAWHTAQTPPHTDPRRPHHPTQAISGVPRRDFAFSSRSSSLDAYDFIVCPGR